VTLDTRNTVVNAFSRAFARQNSQFEKGKFILHLFFLWAMECPKWFHVAEILICLETVVPTDVYKKFVSLMCCVC
jgi:hypothetical protein